ncbi:MAG: hypothetical protein ACLUT7_02670 [Ruminococcus sp.]
MPYIAAGGDRTGSADRPLTYLRKCEPDNVDAMSKEREMYIVPLTTTA